MCVSVCVCVCVHVHVYTQYGPYEVTSDLS